MAWSYILDIDRDPCESYHDIGFLQYDQEIGTMDKRPLRSVQIPVAFFSWCTEGHKEASL